MVLMGFAEGANVILISTIAGLFGIDLQSKQARKVSDHCDSSFNTLVPVVTFYTPAPRGNHQNQLVSKPTEEAGGEEGGDGEKIIHQAQQPFNKGSNVINEGEFVNTTECISHNNNRVSHHGQVALGCAATLQKYRCTYNAQVMNDSLDNVPKSVSSEESLKGTSSEDDAGDSNTSGSNAEVADPSSEKVLR